MKVNILGTDYEIVSGSKEQYPRLKVAAGYTDTSIKRIVILDCNTLENDDANIKKPCFLRKESYKTRNYTRILLRKWFMG